MTDNDSQRVMLITGTSRGIGQQLVEYYLQQGYRVVGCSRSASQLVSADYLHFELDILDENAVKKLFSHLRKNMGRLDVLINNAGVFSKKLAMLTDFASVQRVMQTNFSAAFLFCREGAKLMHRNHFGRIVNISSIAVPLALEGNALYSASKAALEQFSRVFAREVFPMNITVNTLGLSLVANTGMALEIEDAVQAEALRQTTARKPIEMTDITNALDFLLSEESRMVTAQTLYLGGV